MNGEAHGNQGRDPEVVLNAFPILNSDQFRWRTAFYTVRPKFNAELTRGAIKNAVWEARNAYRNECRGQGFVIDVDETTVAIPEAWRLPDGQIGDFEFYRMSVEEVAASDPKYRGFVAKLIKEGLKERFKKPPQGTRLGTFWQDYNDFCQMPTALSENGFYFCRKVQFDVKALKGGGWVLRFVLGTTALDGREIADYYAKGEVAELAEIVLSKLENQPARMTRPVSVRLWYDQRSNGGVGGRVFELQNPSLILQHAKLAPAEQQLLQKLAVPCLDFGKLMNLDSSQCRMLLDTQTTLSDHDEAIIEPSERDFLCRELRNLVNGTIAFGAPINLAEHFVLAKAFRSEGVLPPPIYVRSADGSTVLEQPKTFSAQAIGERTERRKHQIRRFGFVDSRPINPLLACPSFLKEVEVQVIVGALNALLEGKGIDYRFGTPLRYREVEEIRRHIDRNGHDTLLAILPESRRKAPHSHDTHEQIKKRIPVPSQCMFHDTAIPGRFRGKSLAEIARMDNRAASSIRTRLDLTLGNLLVKAHWFPFVPAAPSHYNVHIGLDVGGRRNSEVMACVGYGFRTPQNGLFFRPESIPMETAKAEPIPPKPLFNGLLGVMEEIHSELKAMGETPDWSTVLFMRDGRLLGAADEWNEIDALRDLHQAALDRKWIDEKAVWTAVEIMKAAEGWRLLARNGTVQNPTVGFCCYPFEDDNEALVCTTGQPYLPQGTAAPLKIRAIDICGRAIVSEVVRDLVWESDMCYSKPDMAQSLPWTLHIADTGALQLSRSYKTAGITV